MREDKDVVLEAIKNDQYFMFKYESAKLLNDKIFIL